MSDEPISLVQTLRELLTTLQPLSIEPITEALASSWFGADRLATLDLINELKYRNDNFCKMLERISQTADTQHKLINDQAKLIEDQSELIALLTEGSLQGINLLKLLGART